MSVMTLVEFRPEIVILFQSKNGLPKFLNEASFVVHCKHGSDTGRSFRGAEQLKHAGFNARMYKGGFIGWKEKFAS